jgi:glycosyltransferase involved in cell wall biosynthesis
MNVPQVTVLMSVYNGEKWLSESIESVLEQTFQDFEFVIIDDASTDRSADIINSYKDGRIIYARNAHNMGLTKSLNKGIGLARGEYIARMDADDISVANRLEKQVTFMDANPEVAVCSSYTVFIDELGKKLNSWNDDIENVTYSQIRKTLPQKNCLSHTSVLMRAHIVRAYLYNELQKHSQDWDLWLRLVQDNHRIDKIPDCLVRNRIHSGSVTATTQRDEGKQRAQVVRRNFLRFQITNGKVNVFFLFILKGYLKFKWKEQVRPFRERVANILSIPYAFVLFQKLKNKIDMVKRTSKSDRIVISGASVSSGGVEKVLMDVASSVRDNYDLIFIATDGKNSNWQEEFEKNFKEVFIFRKKLPIHVRKKLLIWTLSRLGAGVVIFSSSPLLASYVGEVKRYLSGTKLIDIVHTEKAMTERMTFEVIRYVDKRVLISNALFERSKRHYRGHTLEQENISKLVVIKNAIESSSYNEKKEKGTFKREHNIEEAHVVTFLGRVDRDKDPLSFVEVAQGCKRKDIGFVIAGGSSYRDGFFEKVEERVRGISNLYLLGHVEDVPGLLSDSDVMVLTSPGEGLPISILEAMVCGVPVIANNVGAVNEIVRDGENGFLVDRDEQMIERIEECITLLISDTSLRSRITDNARRTVEEEFSVNIFKDKYRQLIETINAEDSV